MTYYYICLVIFSVVAYFIIADNSILTYFVLLGKQVELSFAKFMWWIKYSPTNPIVRYLMWRRSWKLAEELIKEMEEQNKNN